MSRIAATPRAGNNDTTLVKVLNFHTRLQTGAAAAAPIRDSYKIKFLLQQQQQLSNRLSLSMMITAFVHDHPHLAKLV
jgi:hypothetical protein